MLDPTNLYESGNLGSGKMTRELRAMGPDGTKPLLVAILETAIAVGTADGTVGALVTALTTARDELDTPATFNKIVAPY